LPDFSGTVVAIHDGDTLTVLVDRKQVKVRIADIDAPEAKQPFGTRSGKPWRRYVTRSLRRLSTRGWIATGALSALFHALAGTQHKSVRAWRGCLPGTLRQIHRFTCSRPKLEQHGTGYGLIHTPSRLGNSGRKGV
jgi:hypothetical protein